MLRRQYPNYAEYLAHQRAKTTNPKLRGKLQARWQADLTRFRQQFAQLPDVVPAGTKALCLGARLGAEVQALKDMGYDAIGIDLVPCPPFVIKGDFHKIPFGQAEFGLVYTNSVDHVYDLDKLRDEISRVLTRPGWLRVQLTMHTLGKYESLRLDAEQDFTAIFPLFKEIWRTDNGHTDSRLRIQLLLQIGGNQ